MPRSARPNEHLHERDIFLCLGFKTILILDIILTVISGCSNYVHPSPAQLRWKREIIYCIYSWRDIHKRREALFAAI